MRTLLAGITTLILGFDCWAAPECKITGYGVFSDPVEETIVESTETATGRFRMDYGTKLVRTTDVVAAILGTSFGVTRVFSGIPDGKMVKLIVHHPPIVSPTGEARTQSIIDVIDETFANAYGFDTPGELVLGEWAFEYKLDERILCKKYFQVVK